MKKFVLVVSLLTACDYSVPSADIVIGTKGIESTWDKAVSDTRNEYDRVESNVIATLVKANMDAVAEEHRFNENVKETGAKANEDTLDTLKKANKDFVNEEHRVNQNMKDTGLKANEDFNHEQARMTDKLVGSDDTALENHEARISALETKAAYLEGELSRISSLESRVSSLTTQDSSIQSALQAGLTYAQGLIASLGSKLDALTSSDIQGLNAQLATLDAAITNIQLLPGPQGVQGAAGPQGATGPQGAQGPAGIDGSDGADGADGADGIDGVDGTNGTDGVDGQSCSVAAVDFNKADCTNQGSSSVMKSSLITITCPANTVSYCVKL